MRFEDEYDDSGGGLPIIYMALAVSFFILVVLGTVIWVNKKDNKSGNNYQQLVAANNTTETIEEETEYYKHKRTADDLDIWDMYPENDLYDDYEEDSLHETEIEDESKEESSESDEEKYDDDKYFKIKLSDGSEEWIAIDSKRKRNSYNFMNLQSSDDKLKYLVDDKVTSFVGVDVSRYQKDIDFDQIKNSGIQFVMLRVGSRGYQTGLLAQDEYFEENLRKAEEAGLDIGVYFYSQAINTMEAVEEANMVIRALTGHKIKYPVAFYMESVENDISRIDSLTKDERAYITATFINTVAAAGYKTLIYGNEEWLVKKLDLNNFPSISIWLADDDDMPDYPYPFAMWQYTTQGNVVGINGNVNMDICFIDYTAQ